ncbi:unnamed protein product [Lepidochelys olivacea]
MRVRSRTDTKGLAGSAIFWVLDNQYGGSGAQFVTENSSIENLLGQIVLEQILKVLLVGAQTWQEGALFHLLQENQAQLGPWQAQGQAECAAPATGDGNTKGPQSPSSTSAPGGQRLGDIAYETLL